MRTKNMWAWSVFFAQLVAAPLAAQLAMVPDRDNTLYEPGGQRVGCDSPNSNGAGQYLFAGVTQNGEERRALLHFDLSSIPPGSTITAVTLALNLNRVAPSGAPTDLFGLRRLTADWGEGTSDGGSEEGGGGPATANDATWCDRFFEVTPWTSQGGDFVGAASATIAVGTTTPSQQVLGSTPGMVADVQGWVDVPASNLGWILLQESSPSAAPGAPEGDVATARRFDSREGAGAVQPVLTVTLAPVGPPIVEVPALSSVGLVLLAGLLLAGAIWTISRSR